MNQKPTLSDRVRAIRLKIQAKQGDRNASPNDLTSIEIDPSREKNGGTRPPVRIVTLDQSSN